MKSSNITCRIRKNDAGYEGTVTIPGLRSTKLVRSSDGQSVYARRSSVVQSAQVLAKRLGMTLQVSDQAVTV